MQIYVETILPWFVILVIIVFLVLVVAGFSTKKLDEIMTRKFAWFFVIILAVVFLISAIYVFNPILHSKYLVSSSTESSVGIVSQIENFFLTSKYAGSVLLLIIGIFVTWVLVRKQKS
jgi:hypothetical protein